MPASPAPKVGDRVRVEFDGIVDHSLSTGRLWIDVGQMARAVVYPEHCTLLTPPVKVGDPATLAILDELPDGSVVSEALGGDVALLRVMSGGFRCWQHPGREGRYPSSEIAYRGPTVLRIGWFQ